MSCQLGRHVSAEADVCRMGRTLVGCTIELERTGGRKGEWVWEKRRCIATGGINLANSGVYRALSTVILVDRALLPPPAKLPPAK